VSSDIAAHSTEEGVKGNHKRCKQRLEGTTTTTSCDDDHNWEAGGSGMGRGLTVAHSDKHQTSLPTNHFKKLLEKACPNHAYPIKHKLKNCGMMRNLMTSWTFT
jgi:hypothetical protein